MEIYLGSCRDPLLLGMLERVCMGLSLSWLEGGKCTVHACRTCEVVRGSWSWMDGWWRRISIRLGPDYAGGGEN